MEPNQVCTIYEGVFTLFLGSLHLELAHTVFKSFPNTVEVTQFFKMKLGKKFSICGIFFAQNRDKNGKFLIFCH